MSLCNLVVPVPPEKNLGLVWIFFEASRYTPQEEKGAAEQCAPHGPAKACWKHMPYRCESDGARLAAGYHLAAAVPGSSAPRNPSDAFLPVRSATRPIPRAVPFRSQVPHMFCFWRLWCSCGLVSGLARSLPVHLSPTSTPV